MNSGIRYEYRIIPSDIFITFFKGQAYSHTIFFDFQRSKYNYKENNIIKEYYKTNEVNQNTFIKINEGTTNPKILELLSEGN